MPRAQEHPIFKNRTPTDDTPIWRYTDFTKFVDLIENHALFFSAASRLGDPFEGSVPATQPMVWQETFRQMPDLRPEVASSLIEHLSRARRGATQHTYVSCWYMNRHESAAMWRLYARTEEAVAIKSTYGALRACLPDESTSPPCVYIGRVDYLDYETAVIPEGNTFWPFLHKRKSFEHENELRGIVQELPLVNNAVDWNAPGKPGLAIPVDVHRLIEAIHVAPTSQPWFLHLVRKLVLRYGLNCEVKQSALDAKPIW